MRLRKILLNRKAGGDNDEVTGMSTAMSMILAAILLALAIGLFATCFGGLRTISNANSNAIEQHNDSIKAQ